MMERQMKASFWMLVGVLITILLFCPLANAGGGTQPPIAVPQTEGWWEVGMFGTSLSQNKERGVVAEDVWIFASPSSCQGTYCYADIRLFDEDGWREVGYGSLSLPPSGNSLWYNFYFYETGDSYYGSIFYFGNSMEGSFSADKWECAVGADYCTLTLISFGRTTFRR